MLSQGVGSSSLALDMHTEVSARLPSLHLQAARVAGGEWAACLVQGLHCFFGQRRARGAACRQGRRPLAAAAAGACCSLQPASLHLHPGCCTLAAHMLAAVSSDIALFVVKLSLLLGSWAPDVSNSCTSRMLSISLGRDSLMVMRMLQPVELAGASAPAGRGVRAAGRAAVSGAAGARAGGRCWQGRSGAAQQPAPSGTHPGRTRGGPAAGRPAGAAAPLQRAGGVPPRPWRPRPPAGTLRGGRKVDARRQDAPPANMERWIAVFVCTTSVIWRPQQRPGGAPGVPQGLAAARRRALHM
jgi:hypothetical protein